MHPLRSRSKLEMGRIVAGSKDSIQSTASRSGARRDPRSTIEDESMSHMTDDVFFEHYKNRYPPALSMFSVLCAWFVRVSAFAIIIPTAEVSALCEGV